MANKENQTIQSLDVIGIGNAIVDVLMHTTDSFIHSLSIKKGNMTLISESQAEEIYLSMKPSLQTSGGSAANTLAGISQLGGASGFIGRVKKDKLGDIFTKEIIATGTFFNTSPKSEGPATARCLILITPDAERTMCTYLGASSFLEPADLDFQVIKNTKVLYLEGYLFDSPAAKNAFYKASEIARTYEKKVALSLSDSFCVDRHRESFLDLIKNHVDIIFANESEIISLFKTNDLKEALTNLKENCDLAIITLGNKGSIIINKGNEIKIKAYSLGNLIDSTGAGDLYASGFLYGYINGKDLKTCGNIGAICAGHIVTQLGPRTNISLRQLIKKNL